MKVRDALAQRWHVPPWIVDEAPCDVVQETLELMRLEAEAERKNG